MRADDLGNQSRGAISFNVLLHEAGLALGGVRLIRHRDREYLRQVYQAAIDRDPRFERYQNLQGSKPVTATLRKATHLASFVVEPGSRATLFVGIWRIRSTRRGNGADPFRGTSGKSAKGVILDTVRLAALDRFHARLVIDWAGGERAWVQRADRQDKEVVELRRAKVEAPFPGFLGLACSLAEIGGLPRVWSERLRETRGVYVLVHCKTGEQYVGSATGDGGFLERWLGYSNGHGGNVAMREIAGTSADYEVSILETVGTGSDAKQVLALEDRWKSKLGTRVNGLNRN